MNLTTMLQGYVSGTRPLGDLVEYLASIDWDHHHSPEMERAGLFELLVTEVAEGLRPEADLYQAASDYVARETGTRWWVDTDTVAGSGDKQ